MGLIEKLMGRRAQTSANLAKELTAQQAGVEASRAKIVAAQHARKAAIEDFDDRAHKAADEASAEAYRDIERREYAIEKLKAARASALDAEAREAFRKEDMSLAQESAALADLLMRDYPGAAETIAQLIGEIEAFYGKRMAHAERGKTLGEPVKCGHPEVCRGVTPKQWSATWPNPDGDGYVKGSIEEAPRGMIKWLDGEPVATRTDVEIRFRGGGDAPLSLVQAVGDLPALNAADMPFHSCRRGDVGALLALYEEQHRREDRY